MSSIVDDPGYHSDTGPRENPTASNFREGRPVKIAIVPEGHGPRRHRALNREGRAICRIAAPHRWSATAIGRIFNVAGKQVDKALKNNYSPPDDTSRDYAVVRKEIAELFPKIERDIDADGPESSTEMGRAERSRSPLFTPPPEVGADIVPHMAKKRNPPRGAQSRPSKLADNDMLEDDRSDRTLSSNASDSGDAPPKVTTADDSDYHSDTGAKENPTGFNFEHNQPVKASSRPVGYHHRVLDREGRAICRIVAAHGWIARDIAHVFSLPSEPIRKAIKNQYVPPDNASRDYTFVTEELAEKFPEIQSSAQVENSGSRDERDERQRSSNLVSPTVQKQKKANGADEAEKKTRHTGGRNQSQSSKPSGAVKPKISGPPARVQPRREPAAPADPLVSFLKNVMGLDMSKHLALFVARGFEDVATLRTIAELEEDTLRSTLRRVLTGSAEELGGNKGLTELELVMLETAMKKLV
ncbi:hypothetical protein C8R47DRAFT_1199514 [Mycena vitilis]|nr:hypothetical protein C8R47DRAFT_1199514 [Mycena vitilis]